MEQIIQSIDTAAAFIRSKISTKPTVGIVLGTGLGALVEKIEISLRLPYTEIPFFPVSTVSFHKGNLLFGKLGDVQVVVMEGRFHYYEGYSMQQVTFPIRVLRALGIEILLLSNAAGGMNPAYKKGDLVLINDHINTLPDNPLRGLPNEMGNRFVDMCCPYNTDLSAKILAVAAAEKISIHEGVYVAVQGPNLETRAEYRYLRSLGADMVGMSTVPEVIVANHIGLPCAAISIITDECDPDNLQPVDIDEIIAIAGKSDQILAKLFEKLLITVPLHPG
ncbi:MAG: purine-nucleoside phosphorylase [Sediminibacterium sp.]|jgi:purine-nucleoside phosphorylase|nr:purine-nucleoside phosphorylase [Chitinophagaceae bacterium]MCA6447207.1 purine-nucleoside phosphorylase [Chitinophagaceae bacterium]